LEYKVLPFAADISEDQEIEATAGQLQTLINQQAAEGWEFVGLENTEIVITVPGQAGCFAMGGPTQTNRVTRFDMAVFRK